MTSTEIKEIKQFFDKILNEYTKINIKNKSYVEYVYLLQRKESIKFNKF